VINNLTVIIPALNEENTIAEVLDQTLAVADKVIVVDDGSMDNTASIAAAYSVSGVRVLSKPSRQGKGAAIRTALPYVDTPLVALQDADLEYPPANLIPLATASEHLMVIGQRTMVITDFYRTVPLSSFAANKIFAYVAGVPDVFSGQRVLHTKFMRSLNLQSNGFEIETEMTFKALKRKVPIKFIPVDYYPRTKEQGKKINFRDFMKISTMYLRLQFSAA
jgi:glycosyltransferase involved in cell wall biosynthesis